MQRAPYGRLSLAKVCWTAGDSTSAAPEGGGVTPKRTDGQPRRQRGCIHRVALFCYIAIAQRCARRSMQACVRTDVDLRMHALCRVRMSCAVQKRLKVMHACILQHSASLFIQVAQTHDPSWFPTWVATRTRGKVRGRGACWPGGKRTHCRCSSGERNQCWQSAANSCKGWSPTQRTGMLTAGTAFHDRLLAS
jgi:hypothetical protein